jgi:predicted Zn-dependent protease
MLTTQNPDPNSKPPFILWRPIISAWHWLVPPTLAHADRQSSTARWIARILVVVIPVTVVAVAFINGREWHHAYKRWRAASIMQEVNKMDVKADSFLEQGMTIEAQQTLFTTSKKADEAYKMDPENIDAIRFWAKNATRGKQGEAANFLWSKLAKLTTPTEQDMAFRIQALTNSYEDKKAEEQIEKAFKETKPTPKTARLADEVMQRMGKKQQLLELLRHYVEERSGDKDMQLLLAMRQVQLGENKDAQEGLSSLWTLSNGEDEVSLKAIEFLYTVTSLSRDEQQKLIELVRKHPLTKEEHRIAALRKQAALDPARKMEIFKNAIEERKNAKRDDLPPLTRWLNDEGQSELVVNFLKRKESSVQEYKPLLDNYLNALTRLNRNEELERLVKDKRTILSTSERAFMLVHLAFVLKKPEDEVKKLIIDALDSALSENKTSMIYDIAQYAESRGMLLEAQKGYQASSLAPRTEQKGYEGMIRVSYAVGDSPAFTKATKETARRWPENQYFLERYLYACLLSGQELETALTRVKKMLEARPNDSQRKLIMALALYRQQDAKESAAVLNNINLGELTVGQDAVFCGILKAAGMVKQATEIAKQIPDDAKMLPEESVFLQRAKG